MKATIKFSTAFLKMLKLIAGLNPEVMIRFEPKKLAICCLSSENVVHAKYEYADVEVEEPFSVCVFIENLTKALKRAKEGADVVVQVEGNALRIEYSCPSPAVHQIALLDESSLPNGHAREPKLPDMLYDARMLAEELAEPCEDALAIEEGAVLNFIAVSTGLSISLPMRAAKQGFVTQPGTESYQFYAEPDVVIRGKFAARFLSAVSPPKGIYATVNVRCGKNYPLELLYENTNAKLRVVIAERTDTD